MNGKEMKKYALLHTGFDEIPDDYILLYINKAILELATSYDTACKKDVMIVNTEGDVWEDIAEDIVAAKRAYKVDGKHKEQCYDFLIENQAIKFPEKGRYEVEVLVVPDKLKSLSNTPEINMLYHEAITFYIAYEEFCRVFMHEDTNKDFLLSRYRELALRAHHKLSFQKRSRKTIPASPFI